MLQSKFQVIFFCQHFRLLWWIVEGVSIANLAQCLCLLIIGLRSKASKKVGSLPEVSRLRLLGGFKINETLPGSGKKANYL